ncbi:terminase small subunit [Agrobacterium vitis]|uniref:terminase small subunit n=1 Tax=Agrobacterium vitis TaxID=373 RepID=UPI001F3B5E9F|nr:terminase small subunit [Agrobacterium vitis]MCF1498916.1 terminase small subunit [Allorhizobium sp. Av2]MCM2441182.1 terminase small subunit [Agrobacterium vitis]
MSQLTEKKRRFVEAYVLDLRSNATRAAITAGYSAKTAGQTGYELLKKPEIQAAIAKERAKMAARYDVSKDRIVSELAKIAYGNLSDFMKVTSDGTAYIDLSEVDRDQMAALTGIEVEEYAEGRGEDKRDIIKTKIKMADKRAALMDLAKLCGHIVEKVEHTGANGGAIETKDVSENEMARRVAFMLAKGMRSAKVAAAIAKPDAPAPDDDE